MSDYDLTSMQVAEPVFGAQVGHGVLRTHGPDKCAGQHCCIHNPSGHHMVTWPLNWRSDTGVMERLCPHGVGHPDPDHMAYVLSLTPDHDCPGSGLLDGLPCAYPHLEWQGTHGCDLCC